MRLFGSMKIEENTLTVGNIKTTALASKYGTPLYVMDEEAIRENCRQYYKNFKCDERNNRVVYAGKAFLTIGMCNIINEEGLNLDVVSGGELYTAYSAGFPMENIFFHGNNKTIEEIQLGVNLGVGNFVVDNYYEAINLSQIAKEKNIVQDIFLRITPGIEAHTHDYIKTGQIDSKFGYSAIDDNIINAINKILELDNINLVGLHCHIGSQIFDVTPYKDAARIMLNLINLIKNETGYLIESLNLGGGFGIYYSEGDEPRETHEYCEAIISEVDRVCSEINLKVPTLVIEPGRSIVGNTGFTIYKVGSIKEIPNIRKYVSVDGGMSDNIRPALYSAQYECFLANRVIHDTRETVTVSGKCCESGDILLNSISIPEVKSGDILAIMSTGAYGYSMSSNYNKMLKPAVVMVRDGESRVICKRQTYEDLIKNEVR